MVGPHRDNERTTLAPQHRKIAGTAGAAFEAQHVTSAAKAGIDPDTSMDTWLKES